MRACPFFILINAKTLKGKPLVFLYLKRPQVAVASRQNLLRISRCEAGRKTAETTRRKFCTELFCEAETTLVLNLSGFELFCCLRETQTFPGVVLRSGNNSGEKSFRTKLLNSPSRLRGARLEKKIIQISALPHLNCPPPPP